MEGNQRGCTVCVLSSLCVLSIAIVLMITCHLSSFMNYSSSRFELSLPIVELQTTFYSSDHNRAVDSGGISGDLYASRLRNQRKIKKLSREQELERGLARARASILNAASARNLSITHPTNDSDVLIGDIYFNRAAFHRSYLEMERKFKVYVYEEGEQPMVHDGPCKDIYSIEGRFIHEMERGASVSTMFKTRDPLAAHVFFLPFSVAWMVKYMYKPHTYDVTPLKQFVSDYVRVIATRHPFWNKTHGADHFMLACHDWGPHATKGDAELYNSSIRVLCNANTSEGFNPEKDVSLPEISLYGGEVSPKLLSPPPSDAPRRFLAFFAGGLHGPIRPILLKLWKNRDNDMPIYEYLPKTLDYYDFMLNSRFCLCPSGYEVASPRIVEAVYAECIPVILSDHYSLPFGDVLRWEAFSVQVRVSEIPRLKEILSAVSDEKYRKLKENLMNVRKHFELNQPAKRYDVFHMILHSVWLRRINFRLN